MHRSVRACAVVALLAAAACVDDTVTPRTTPPTPGPSPVGVYTIEVRGIGTDQMSSQIRLANPGTGAGRTLTVAGSGITFEQVSSNSFTEGTRTGGGQRYVTFTYRVRNGTGASLNNLTLLMVSRASTIAGTPISSLTRFDGSAASSTIAERIVPTGAVALGTDLVSMQALYPDVIQVLQEAEVAAITPPGDVTGIFPYGYMIRNADATTPSRLIPNATSANQFDGVLTVSFRLPLQATAAQDAFSLGFQVLAVQDSETRLTESMEEAQDTAAVRRIRERATALGATTVTILPGSTAAGSDIADYTGQRQICTVRTSGTAASPTHYITEPAGYTKLEMLFPGESSSACGARFRSGTATTPTLNVAYPVTVKAMDRYGNLLTSTVDSVTLSRVSGPTATFGSQAALSSGTASISATYTANGTSVLAATGRRNKNRRTVEVPVSATIEINAGDNQVGMAGVAVPTKPAVLVKDLGGNPLSGVSVTFSVASGGGSVTGGTTTTNGSGIATVGNWVMGSPATLNTLTATAVGASSSVTFKAAGCSGGGGAGYAITLCYNSALTATQRAAFDSAAAKWNRVITGDLSNVNLNVAAGSCGSGSPAVNQTIDDLLIVATVEPIDGAGGILGSAGPCYVRGSNSLPINGIMRFDVADMGTMESNGTMQGVLLHEMGHVIGVGTLWTTFSLLQNASPVGGPPLDTYFSGTNGIAGFNSIGGSTYTGGNKVPVENQYGAGTINGHWRESVLQNELMTGFANAGSMPMSLLTVRSLTDLGYTVDTANADSFFLTLTIRQGVAPDAVPLGDDVLVLPRRRVDDRGRMVAPEP